MNPELQNTVETASDRFWGAALQGISEDMRNSLDDVTRIIATANGDMDATPMRNAIGILIQNNKATPEQILESAGLAIENKQTAEFIHDISHALEMEVAKDEVKEFDEMCLDASYQYRELGNEELAEAFWTAGGTANHIESINQASEKMRDSTMDPNAVIEAAAVARKAASDIGLMVKACITNSLAGESEEIGAELQSLITVRRRAVNATMSRINELRERAERKDMMQNRARDMQMDFRSTIFYNITKHLGIGKLVDLLINKIGIHCREKEIREIKKEIKVLEAKVSREREDITKQISQSIEEKTGVSVAGKGEEIGLKSLTKGVKDATMGQMREDIKSNVAMSQFTQATSRNIGIAAAKTAVDSSIITSSNTLQNLQLQQRRKQPQPFRPKQQSGASLPQDGRPMQPQPFRPNQQQREQIQAVTSTLLKQSNNNQREEQGQRSTTLGKFGKMTQERGDSAGRSGGRF